MHRVTLCVGSVGNQEGLLCTLSSIANQTVLPASIHLYLLGDRPKLNNFYLEQLLCLIRHRDCETVLYVAQDKGISKMYDRFINDARTELCWFVNDDVIFDSECLEQLLVAWDYFDDTTNIPFITGTKPDLVNANSYRDYTDEVLTRVEDNGSPHRFYLKAKVPLVVERLQPDLGNCLVNKLYLKRNGITIASNLDEFEPKVLGDDWILGAKLKHTGYLCPRAQSYHLDKPSLNTFNRNNTNKALVHRTIKLLDLNTDIINKEWKA